MEAALSSWDSENTRLGNLFSNTFWSYYRDYYQGYGQIKSLLLSKQREDPSFEEFCELRRQQGRQSLEALLAQPVKRVPDYARYLNDLLEETDPSHPDYEDLSKAAGKVTSMVKERENVLSDTQHSSAMDAVQGRFPKDDLRLHQSHTDIGKPTSPTSNNAQNKTETNSNDNDNGNNNHHGDGNNNQNIIRSTVESPASCPSALKQGQTMHDKNDSHLTSSATTTATTSTIATSPAISPDVSKRKQDKSNGNSDLEIGSKGSPSGMPRKSKNGSSSNTNEDKTAQTSKTKALSTRRRSAPSAVLFKSLAGSRSRSSGSLWSNAGMGKKDHDVISAFKVAESDSNRMFITEGPVQLASGMQIQERYLFLFTDLLLVAKQKSSTAFKLKQRVELCDMWIASCIEEVSETTRPSEKSFVLGWPTTNVVATFPTDQIKADWLQKLSERITEEKLRDEGKTLQLKVSPRDIESSNGQVCQMTINNETQAKDVLQTCLKQLKISESESSNYQLWVISGKEGSPYPLIGHETPFSIKLSQVRELSRSRSRDDVANITSTAGLSEAVDDCATAGQKCEFYVKHKKTPKKHHMNDDSSYQKSMKKSKKSPNIISNLLRKIRSPHPLVFGLPLTEICDENLDPPESVIRLMVLVYRRGPTVPGILRRGNKIALAKEIREKIDAGLKYTIEDHQAPTAASVFKEFLRCIPGGLLVDSLHDQWITVNKDDPVQVKLDKLKNIISQLPPAHLRLLKLSICLLQHLAKHSAQTNMGPTNLATCIAPSFCPSCTGASPGPGLSHSKNSHGGFPSPGSASSASTLQHVQNSMKEITTVFTPLIAFMIVKHVELFGSDILTLFTKFNCEVSPAVSLEETGQEESGEAGGEEIDDNGNKISSINRISGGTLVQSSMEDEAEEEDDDDEMTGEEDDDEEEDGFGRDYDHHQAQLRHRPHSKHRDQHQVHRTDAPSGPRDSNSGTDSDSMHSVLSMPDTGSGMGYRRDDSSLDSLVDREYFQHEEAGSGSPQAHKSHLSPSNLSRDSGLTLSDTQLYDEEVGTGFHPGDSMAGRLYQRSASSNMELENHQPQESNDWLARSMVDSRTQENRHGYQSQHPLLGREGKKKSRDSSEGSDSECGQGQSGFSPATFRTRPPFKHSSSSPLLDIQPRAGGKAEPKPCLTHSPLGKRISSDSIGEEDEGQYDQTDSVSRHSQVQPQYQTGQPGSAIDFRRLRLNKDMGTIVKSNSGTHLFLSDDTLPTRFNLTRTQGKASPLSQSTLHTGSFFLRQDSVTDSLGSPTPPTSPDVKDSDTNSPLSKLKASCVPESIKSLTQTKPVPWEPGMNSAYRDWDGQLANTFSSGSLNVSFSKSTSDLRAQNYGDDEVDDTDDQDKTITADNISKLSSRPESPAQLPSPKLPPPSPKLWSGRKSHEAEEVVDMRKRPHFSLMLRPESDFVVSQSQPFRKRSLGLPPQHLIKGSPPPNVILQSLSGSRKEVSPTSAPLRASYDSAILSQVRRSSAADLASHGGRDIIKSINAIRPEEYVSVTSKPIMITSRTGASSEGSGFNSTPHSSSLSSSSFSSLSLASPVSSQSPISSASARRAKLAKHMGTRSNTITSSKEQAAETFYQRPDKPPNYHQALQRNFMIKHSVPIDMTDDDTGKQKELNAKAKALYEKSLQLYDEQRKNSTKEDDSLHSRLKDNSVHLSSQNKDSVIRQDDRIESEVQSGRTLEESVVRSVSQHFKNSSDNFSESSPTESGFLDLGSISHSLQTDVLSRREKHHCKTKANSSETLPSSSENSTLSTSLSRHDSRLSDISGSSSGGSTITISTLGHPSDTSSGSRASMASSLNSSAGGESSVESGPKHNASNDKDILRMSYSRHFRPQDGSQKDSKDEVTDSSKQLEWTSEGEGVYVSLKKNPQQLYLESKKMYEQKQNPIVPFHTNPHPPSFSSPSSETKTVQSPISPFHSQLPATTGPYSHPNSVQLKPRAQPRPKSIHDTFALQLQRSQSDASDSSARAVRHNPRVKASVNPQSQATEAESPKPQSTPSIKPATSSPLCTADNLETLQDKSVHCGPSDMPSEHHQNFLKARSLFYNPEDSNSNNVKKTTFKVIGGPRKSTSSSVGPLLSSSVSTSNLSNVKYENSLTPFSVVEDMSVESGHLASSKSYVSAKPKIGKMSVSTLSLTSLQPSPSSSMQQPVPPKGARQTKQELPWSVKTLKTLYDRDIKDTDNSVPFSQPPPYKNPPPFQRSQEHSRVSTSSSSSAGSESGVEPNRRKSSFHPAPVHRSGGPQALAEGFSSFTSSEDGYNSSLERKSRRSLDSSQEALSDHTNITYV